ncbi:DNA primase [Buchnera aphidicola (Ceratoglyphina bambusae)]|uniref:DNA primase n=1 Tax=Buchnera aphidicola TaxID=9 RepID=UPI0031B87FBE
MLEKIPKNFINELLHNTNIVEIINSKMKVKKIGKNYYSLCPFHNEKTPSFSISYEKQFYYCFGCHVHGNAIDFLMNYEKINFIESIKELSELNGMKIPYEKNKNYEKENNQKNELHKILHKVLKKYKKNILKEKNKNIKKYLFNRGINEKSIKIFSLGYSCNIIKKYKKNIYNDKKYKKKLIESGILYKNKKNILCNRFINRIMFPIKNINGKINGFGGRSTSIQFPKYINSPETKIFQKRNNLYGLYELYKYNKKIKKIIIVEGYFDVIKLHQNYIKYTVSTLGTSINQNTIKKLFRISDTLIYCYDGDIAGKKAAWKTLEISLPCIYDNKILKFIFLPKGEDPDSIIQKEGRKKFKMRIKKALPMSEFLFEKLIKNVNLLIPEEKSKFSNVIIKMIEKIPGKMIKTFLKKKLKNKLGILDIYKFNNFFLKKKVKKKNINTI